MLSGTEGWFGGFRTSVGLLGVFLSVLRVPAASCGALCGLADARLRGWWPLYVVWCAWGLFAP